jgi:cytosine/adenosine deaminase-related metal-dependent hydrolase
VHLDRVLPGTIAHNPRSNMNNSVGYGAPTARPNRVVLGTDGIGADMLEEARLAYVRLREHDVGATPETVWSWLEEGYRFFPECRDDRVEFNYDHADSAWHTAFSPGVRAVNVTLGSGEVVLRDGKPTRVDLHRVRAKAAEQAQRLFDKL